MNNKEFEALEQRIAAGGELTTVEKWLHRQESQRRAQPLNPLEKQNAARQKNALLENPAPWYMKNGIGTFAERKQGNS